LNDPQIIIREIQTADSKVEAIKGRLRERS